jgi:hypothetical protein
MMKKSVNQMRIMRLMNLVQELDEKSSQLVSVIDENGLDDKKDYSRNYEEIGRKYFDLHGVEQDYLFNQISKLIEIIYWMICEENPNVLDSVDELYNMFFGMDDKEYKNTQDKLFKAINNDKVNEISYKFQDYDMNNLIEDDVEEPEFFNLDITKWNKVSDNILTYEFSRNTESLHGILVPVDLYDYFDISEEDKIHTNNDDCRIIRLFYRKKAHECYILGSVDKSEVYLYWVQRDFRKKLIKRFPEYFSHISYNEANKDNRKVYIVFDKTHKKENKFYSIDFVVK